MKIILVAPIVYVSGAENPPHMGLYSLKAVLAEHKHSVEITDLNPILTHPYEAQQDKAGILNPEFYQQTVTDLLAYDPDIVGFSTIGASYPTTLLLVKMLKCVQPELTVILGGIQASLCAEETLKHFPEVDYIIAGEAEESLPIFLHHLETGTPFPPQSGLYYRTSTGSIAFTGEAPLIQNLDRLPVIDYQQVDLSVLPEISIDVGRGCPFQCYYCCTNNYWRRTYRLRSAKDIVAEIEHHYLTYGKTYFAFNHDLLTCNHKRFRELLGVLKERNLRIHWRCSSRIDTIHEELLAEMAETGCYHIFFGIETGSPRMQKVIKKNLNLSRVLPLLEECKKHKIDCTVSFICGMPEETMEDLLQTIELVYDCIVRYVTPQIHLLAPFQGTDLYRQNKDQLHFDGIYSNVGGFVINNQEEEELIKAYPELFCNFYYIENPQISRTILRNVEQVPKLLSYFWRTIGILRFTHAVSFSEILLTFLEQPVELTELPGFIKSWIRSVKEADSLLQEIFDFEETLFRCRFNLSTGDSIPMSPIELKSEAYFRKTAGSMLYPLSFDPAEVEEAIRQQRSTKNIATNQDLTALISAPRQGAIPHYSAVPSNSSVIHIYHDATGTLRIQDVIDEATEALQGTYSAEEVKQSVMHVFRQLVNLQLIALETR